MHVVNWYFFTESIKYTVKLTFLDRYLLHSARMIGNMASRFFSSWLFILGFILVFDLFSGSISILVWLARENFGLLVSELNGLYHMVGSILRVVWYCYYCLYIAAISWFVYLKREVAISVRVIHLCDFFIYFNCGCHCWIFVLHLIFCDCVAIFSGWASICIEFPSMLSRYCTPSVC